MFHGGREGLHKKGADNFHVCFLYLCCYFQEEVDAGGIISQGVVPVEKGDTVEILQERVKRKEWEIYPKAMELIASGEVRLIDGKVVFT